jgi:hypothetical protein
MENEKCKSVQELETTYPQLVAQLRADARQTERERIKDIFAMAPYGKAALAFALAFDEPCSPGEAAQRFLPNPPSSSWRSH